MAELVNISVADRIAVLTIDNPKVNAISQQTMTALDAAVTRAINDAAVKVLILTGAGSFAFVAGADVTEIARITSGAHGAEMAAKGQAVLNRLEQSPKPVIAAINGPAVGVGATMTLPMSQETCS